MSGMWGNVQNPPDTPHRQEPLEQQQGKSDGSMSRVPQEVPPEGKGGGVKHYEGDIEPIDFMFAQMTREEFEGFLKGNIIKYVSRATRKGGLEDYQKAKVYLDWLIDMYMVKDEEDSFLHD